MNFLRFDSIIPIKKFNFAGSTGLSCFSGSFLECALTSAFLIFFSFGFCYFFGDSLNEACDLNACFCFFGSGEGGEAGELGDDGEVAVDGCQETMLPESALVLFAEMVDSCWVPFEEMPTLTPAQ